MKISLLSVLCVCEGMEGMSANRRSEGNGEANEPDPSTPE